MRRCALVLNAKSGALLAGNPDATAETIAEPFRRRGDIVAITKAEPQDIEASLRAAIETGPDVLLVGGGDGTQRTAGRLLVGSSVPLGVVPLGTLNILAQMIDVPTAVPAAAEALADAVLARMDAAEVNGEVFLCNSMIGLTLTYSRDRARLRGAPLSQRIVGYATTLRTLLGTTRRIALLIDDGDERRFVRAATVIVTNNPYADDAAGLGLRRASLDAGTLALYISRHDSGWRLARSLVRMSVGAKVDDPKLERVLARSVVIDAGRRRMSVSNDGEIEQLRSPLHYRILPRSLCVLVPRTSVHAASTPGERAT